MKNFDELLKKYADFIVRVGVNPQPGQTMIIRCPLEPPRWPACVCAAALRPVPVMFRWTGATMLYPAPGWSWAARRP